MLSWRMGPLYTSLGFITRFSVLLCMFEILQKRTDAAPVWAGWEFLLVWQPGRLNSASPGSGPPGGGLESHLYCACLVTAGTVLVARWPQCPAQDLAHVGGLISASLFWLICQ